MIIDIGQPFHIERAYHNGIAPPRKHHTGLILDAARTIVLRDGPRAASVAAIASASGAPVGTLYHRFGSRDRLLVAVWLRALDRFQEIAIAAARSQDDPLERGVGLARASLEFAHRHADDARLLLTVRRDDLLDAAPDDTLRQTVDAMNEPLLAELRLIAVGLYGRADQRGLATVTRAVVDLPGSALRRHLTPAGLPSWLMSDVAADAKLLLAEPR